MAGWLLDVARNVCRNARRMRSVRQHHEREAAEMNTRSGNQIDVWSDVKELLDESKRRGKIQMGNWGPGHGCVIIAANVCELRKSR